MISFIIENNNGQQQPVEIPEGITLNLMEVLKASGYDILATCGGMALCATCLVQAINGCERLDPPKDTELDMLDTLPYADEQSRLACQISIDDKLNGCIFKLPG